MSKEFDIFNFEDELALNKKYYLSKSMDLINPNANQDEGDHLQLEIRPSIQNGLPIPKSMLSEDAYELQNRSYHQDQSSNSQLQNEMMQKKLIMELRLEEILNSNSPESRDNTKNVLRNLGYALNYFIINHHKAQEIVQNNISSSKDFYQWVGKLRMENFDHFRQIWLGNQNKLYARIYKKLSWIFFSEYSVPYLHSSRIRKVKTRHSHLKHIYRFLEGIQKPETFNYFKKLLR